MKPLTRCPFRSNTFDDLARMVKDIVNEAKEAS